MHEMSLATALLDQVLDIARAHGAVEVESVSLICGVQRQVVPEAMTVAFEAVTKGTLAEGARLLMREEPIRARCNLCTHEFDAEIDHYLCPRCHEADVELVAGDDVILESVVCHAEGEGEESE